MAEVLNGSTQKAVDSFNAQEFVEAHGDRLLRSAYLLCGNETEAQDLVQETIIQAIQSWRGFRGESALYTWIRGILLNLCRRHHRKQKRLVYDGELVLRETFHYDHAQQMDQDFCAERVTQAMQELSEEHREVLILRYFENMKIAEIAQQTGVSGGTVKSRLHYAVRCLELLIPQEMNPFASEGTNHGANQ
ncbi:MAG: polymerase, sigma-24 subunit, subfamily [Verrucomicrobiales bacterium]|nr:polymerase, sigma-24 subunit, subfamily [Verrucomicrobiales bacterium]